MPPAGEQGLAGVQQRAGATFNGAALMPRSSGNLYKARAGTSAIDHRADMLKEVSAFRRQEPGHDCIDLMAENPVQFKRTVSEESA